MSSLFFTILLPVSQSYEYRTSTSWSESKFPPPSALPVLSTTDTVAFLDSLFLYTQSSPYGHTRTLAAGFGAFLRRTNLFAMIYNPPFKLSERLQVQRSHLASTIW